MDSPEKTALQQELAQVVARHAEAKDEFGLNQAYWEVAARDGEDAEADRLETLLEQDRRLIGRLELRRVSLEQQIAQADEVDRAIAALKLKATADNLLARASKRIADMEPVAAALAKLADELEGDFNAWREARHYAKAAGASPVGFATQANEALLRRVTDSLATSRTRTCNVGKELSRVSVFQ